MNPNKADVAKAYLNGLKTHGDPEMLKDIGIPVDPEVVLSNLTEAESCADRFHGMGPE